MTETTGIITGRRVSHEDVELESLEEARFPEPRDRIAELLAHDEIAEAFLLQTCNRIEEYTVLTGNTNDPDIEFAPSVPDEQIVEMGHRESLRHLLRVTAGLESQVLGEDQILGQVRDAYTMATENEAIGPVLEGAVLKAIHVGERARTETAINEGIISLGSAAVKLAEQEIGLADATVVVIGAGTIAKTVLGSLSDETADIRLLNRTEDRAEALADRFGQPTHTAELTELETHLAAADVAITSTGSEEPIIDTASLRGAGEMFIVDLAQPRDVDPAAEELSHVSLRNLDGLESVTETTHRNRQQAATQVEEIVEDELELLLEQYKREQADDVIAAMHRGADQIKQRELSRALRKLDELTDEEQNIVTSLADSIVSQIMAIPTESLRDAAAEDDWETISTAIEIFDPGVDEGQPEELIDSAESEASSPTEADGRENG